MKLKRQKTRTPFKIKELEQHISSGSSCLFLETTKDHFAFYPYHLNDLIDAVKGLLNKKIGKFSPRLDGILCGYKNIKLLSDTGVIQDDSCFIHINTEADYFIFKPALHKVLHGVVNKISEDHVGCLVYNLFNISLPKPKNEENWIGDSLTFNSEIELEITYTNFDGRIPYIRGIIKNVIKEGEVTHTDENLSTKSKKKKRKTTESEEIDDAAENDSSIKAVSRKRKLIFEDDINNESFDIPKKKKKKEK